MVFQPVPILQVTLRQVNAHLWAATGSAYVNLPDGRRLRISYMRTRKGVREGRVVLGSAKPWEVIPDTATIELC